MRHWCMNLEHDSAQARRFAGISGAPFLPVPSLMWRMAINAVRLLLLTLSLCAITNCAGSQVTVDEVETRLQKQSSDGLTTVEFTCTEGQAGWNYVCQARYEPVSPRSRTKPRVQRVGVKQMGSYQERPAFSVSPLPNEGPVLTADELAAYREARDAEASQRAHERKR